MSSQYDIVIVGAGIVGLTLAREVALRKLGKILILEKEPAVGRHASGRNSGVVHAGIYYAADSLKARFCVDGHRRLLQYAEENKLPFEKCGKVIVATKPENTETLSVLLERAKQNGVTAKRIDLKELADLEPEAKSHEWAIWSPNTAIIDSKAVLHRLVEEIQDLGVRIEYGEDVRQIDVKNRQLRTHANVWNFGYLCNTAGIYADQIAHQFGIGLNYRILPFKGLYWDATPGFTLKIRGLIYPAPDIHMPFLGVHITRTVDGHVLFGPTAIPAFGRENYSLFGGLDLLESPKIGWQLLRMMMRNPGGFRDYVRQEIGRYRFRNFYREALSLVQGLEPKDIGAFYKVGIRAQLMDLKKGRLEMDFILEKGPHSLHVLNAISPAFTSALGFAPYLADQIETNRLTAGANRPDGAARN